MDLFVVEKEEAYSYDELSFLKDTILPLLSYEEGFQDLNQKLWDLQQALQGQQESQAIFFMPQNSFNVFALLQGDRSICQIYSGDIKLLLRGLEIFCGPEAEGLQNLISFEKKKLESLYNFMEEGNEVRPLPIQIDNLKLFSC